MHENSDQLFYYRSHAWKLLALPDVIDDMWSGSMRIPPSSSWRIR